MPRNPNDPNSRSSGEWSPFVTLEAFGNFLIEFREGHKHTDRKLDEITQRIAKGDTKFEMLQRDAADCKAKQGEHSTLIKALTTEAAVRKATAAAAAVQPPPMGPVANAAITTLVSILITASAMFVYKLFVLDVKQDLKQEEKTEKTEKTETHPAHPTHTP